jgi:hypothetical protein
VFLCHRVIFPIKTTTKEEKSIKMKELLFAPDPSNHIKFLQAILLKHGLENYEVMEKKHFPVKYGLAKTKVYVGHNSNYD